MFSPAARHEEMYCASSSANFQEPKRKRREQAGVNAVDVFTN